MILPDWVICPLCTKAVRLYFGGYGNYYWFASHLSFKGVQGGPCALSSTVVRQRTLDRIQIDHLSELYQLMNQLGE